MSHLIAKVSRTLATRSTRLGFLSTLGKVALGGAAAASGLGFTRAFTLHCYCCGIPTIRRVKPITAFARVRITHMPIRGSVALGLRMGYEFLTHTRPVEVVSIAL